MGLHGTIRMMLGAAAAAALLAWLPTAARAQDAFAPQAVIDRLTTMDKQLNKLIVDGLDKSISLKEMRSGIVRLLEEKGEMISTFPRVFGNPFATVYYEFEDIDHALKEADIELAVNHDTAAAVKQLEEAKKVKQRLETRLHASSGVPESALTAAQKMDRDLTRAIDEGDRGKLSLGTITELQLDGHAIYHDFPDVFGVAWYSAYFDLYFVDRHLKLALDDTHFYILSGADVAVPELKEARKYKEELEHSFREVRATCPSTKGIRASTASGCPAPPCKPGTFTSGALQVTAPSQPQGAQYYFTTPIPNWLYYNHRHGFTSGGCNHEQGKVLVNIELLAADNHPIAWNLEYGPGISPGQGQPAVMVYSGNACPFVQSGQTFDGCRIDNPELAYPLPSQGYIGTFSGDASADPFYAADIDVHPAAMVGSTDTVHALVTWKLP